MDWTEMIDIERVRADSPACQHVLHFNNAGASLMPAPVFDAVQRVLHEENAVGGYEAERRASEDLAAFYAEFAGLLNAETDEIAYVENATRAWDMAFYGLDLRAGDRIITHGSEYASNYLAFLQQAKRRDLHIDIAPSDRFGQIDLEGLERLINPKTRLIAITHVPTQGGLVNPAVDVGKIARRHSLLYMLDACQSVGQIDVDVKAIGCDVLSGTGRKFLRGPRGTGFLYVRREALQQIEPPFLDLHAAGWTGPQSYELADGARPLRELGKFRCRPRRPDGSRALCTSDRLRRHRGARYNPWGNSAAVSWSDQGRHRSRSGPEEMRDRDVPKGWNRTLAHGRDAPRHADQRLSLVAAVCTPRSRRGVDCSLCCAPQCIISTQKMRSTALHARSMRSDPN